ncbi:MAG TPA: cysteine--tRNA ligase, partial [Planctomycetota bacterium]|nr:cysteine--tRNA ligase [Planctomycetota bacterium]
MAIRFYNTLTRTVQDFTPLREGKVGMYNCGPTVYNYATIGNFRAFMLADLLHRYLKLKGFEVTQVMNLTDVGHMTTDADEG